MKIIICCFLLLFILACEESSDNNEFKYDYMIARSSYLNGNFQDSLSYYYHSGNRLVHVDACLPVNDCREYPVVRKDKEIASYHGSFYTDDDNRITKWIFNNLQVDYRYENDLLVHEKISTDHILGNEHHYYYDDNNLVSDSGIYYDRGTGEKYITVYDYHYTDTLAPDFLIGFSGLFEYPSKHQHLIKKAEAFEHGIRYKYSYEISENRLTEHKAFYDMHNEESDEVWTTRYYFMETD